MNTTPPERNIDDYELSHRLSKSLELLKEFRSAFMHWAIVESEGKFPSAFLEFDIEELEGATGILQLNSHPRTGRISCRFKPQFGGEELSWTHYETGYDLSEYERLLFSTWSYDTGYALDRNEKSEAVWYIDDQAIADRLEDIAEKVDELLNTIDDPLSTFYAVISTVKNHKPKWKPGRVSWYYIKELDERIRELELTYKRLSIGTEAKPKIEPGKGKLLESIHRAYEDLERLVGTDGNLDKLSFEETAYAEAVVIDYLMEKFGEQDDALGNWPSDWYECPEAFDLYKAKIREFRAGQAKASLDEVKRIAKAQPKQKIELDKKLEKPSKEIPPEYRTLPMSQKELAELWGKHVAQKDIAAMIRTGALNRIEISRQRLIFDKRDLPKNVIEKLTKIE